MDILITEQQLRRIILEQSSSTVTVSSGYTTSDCDELHAFQSTKKTVKGKEVSKIIGDMNGIVGKKLEELYKNGINPMVSKVDVTVNGNRVDWTCTIGPSSDGKAWMGFTSRGAGCNNGNVLTRSESSAAGNDMATLKSTILGVYKSETSIDLEMVNDFIHLDGGKVVTDPKTKVSNIKGSGSYAFRQIFYRYTKPNEYPPVGKKTPVNKPTPVNNVKTSPVVSGGDISFTSPDLSTFLTDIKTKTLNTKLDLKSVKIDVDNRTLSISTSGTGTLVKKLVLTLSTQAEGSASADNVMDKNPGSKIVTKGKFQIDSTDSNNYRIYYLIAII
jgi:hypothetical protein